MGPANAGGHRALAEAGTASLEEAVVEVTVAAYADLRMRRQQTNRERGPSWATGKDSIPKASGKECSMHDSSECPGDVTSTGRCFSECTHAAAVVVDNRGDAVR